MREAVINISRLTRLRLPRMTPQQAGRIVLAVIAAVIMWGMFYQVAPDEAGVVLRFGRFVRVGGPGLRLQLPFVETVTKVPVQRQLRQQFGFRTNGNGVREKGDFSVESTMLTGDLNVVVVEWIVQYRIADPVHLPLQSARYRSSVQ